MVSYKIEEKVVNTKFTQGEIPQEHTHFAAGSEEEGKAEARCAGPISIS